VLSWLQSYLSGRSQFVKLGDYHSPTVSLNVGVPQGSVLGPILFAAYCSRVGDVIAGRGVQYHQYADDMQLHLAMHIDNTVAELSVLTACTSDARLWYMQSSVQLNTDKSEALIVGMSPQTIAADSGSSADVGVWSDTIQNGILQCSVAWCHSRDNQQAAVSAEQCGSDYFKHQNDPMPNHCFGGYRLSRGLPI